MARHSHWANIKHKKAKTDAKRGKVWSKCARAIMVAAKHGGADPDANLALRYAIDEARFENMPRDTIERAAKKGAGELGGAEYVSARYEGYAPGGVAVIVDALTDNRTRTAGDVRSTFIKYAGNLGPSGCVSHTFENKGVLTILEADATEDKLMEIALETGADDVSLDDGVWSITCAPTAFLTVKKALEAGKLKLNSAELSWLPMSFTSAAGDTLAQVVKLIDALEDNDDVQKVYTNLDASAQDLAALGA